MRSSIFIGLIAMPTSCFEIESISPLRVSPVRTMAGIFLANAARKARMLQRAVSLAFIRPGVRIVLFPIPSGKEAAEIFGVDNLEGRECIMYFGKVDARG